jgi:GH18 family chitinase
MHFYESYFPKEKLFVGIPLFFTTYAGASAGDIPSHYASPYSGPGYNPLEPDVPGELLYKEVVQDLRQNRAKGFWDKDAKAFSVYYDDSKTFGSGMNDESIQKIQDFIKNAGYGGAFVWELRGDTYDWHALQLLSSK